jgi:hypothetical protein
MGTFWLVAVIKKHVFIGRKTPDLKKAPAKVSDNLTGIVIIFQ